MRANHHGVAAGSFQSVAPADGPGLPSGPGVTFASTEHFNLQTARALTVAEANGRASIYLAALSSNLIALAFIGQMSRLGTAFYAFALILLPVLAFVGTVTFLRLVQSSVEDIARLPARRRARIATRLLPDPQARAAHNGQADVGRPGPAGSSDPTGFGEGCVI